jgi:rod shape determining protein RodA
MRNRSIIKDIDWLTVVTYLLLVSLGWMNIYAAVYNEQHTSIFDISQRYGKQMVWILAALVLIIIVFILDSKFYSFFAYIIFLISVLSLAAVLVFGREIHGARSWFVLGSFNFQPSEFAKIATGLALARLLSTYNFNIHQFKSILLILLIILLPAGLIALQPDMGSALVFAALLIVIYREGFSGLLMVIGFLLIILFITTLLLDKLIILTSLTVMAFIVYWIMAKRRGLFFRATVIFLLALASVYLVNYMVGNKLSTYLVSIIALAITMPVYLIHAYRKKVQAVFYIVTVFTGLVIYTFSVDYVFHELLEEHQQRRVNILLGIEHDPLGVGYNVNQSKIAIGSGGLTGKGFLRGTQTKFNFVPEQSTDFIFCTVGEEWGFVGTSVVMGLFMFLLLRLLVLAERQRSVFSRAYGYVVISILFFHIAVNIGMTLGLLPVIGIPLPFFSYGGSSLWAFSILLFIFIRLDASRMELIG